MSFNGSGTFIINSAGQPVVANTVISATVFNALTADLATGLTNCITRDGQSTPTANIPMGNNKLTGLGAGTAATDAATLGQVQSTAAKLITVTGTDTIAGTMSPALTAYAAGQLFYFIANAANTGAMTINIDGLGAKNITRDGSTALIAGDVNTGEIVVICYDGTRFQMINAANSFGNTTINGTLTVTGNTALQANVSITSALSVGGVFAVTGAATLGSTLEVTGKSDLPTVSTASMNAAVAVITTGTVTNLTSTSASIASANAAVALITTGTVTNLTATGASIASANLGNAVITSMTLTGASVASANVGTATITGNLTLSGGTANGVLYLNASKVATSGSALTFDGTNLTATGTSTFGGSTEKVIVNRLSDFTAYGLITFNGAFGSATGAGIYGRGSGGDSGSLYYNVPTGAAQRFQVNGDTKLTLDSSGNLGIGTASPGSFYSLADNLVIGTGSGGHGMTIYSGSGDSGFIGFNDTASASMQGYIQYNHNGDYFAFAPAGTEKLRLDASGNLGLGVTPSAWRSADRALDLPYSSFFDNSSTTAVGRNFYINSSNATIYRGSDFATSYSQSSGQHIWYTAPSGTAGNTITFTQALTLDANVNLLLNGTTAPASGVGTFAIFNGTAPTGSVTNGCVLYTEDVSSSSELKVRDEAGNVTTLSPHNFSLIPEGASEDMAWAYYSEKGGKRINVDMLKLARMVEKLTGEKLVYEA